MAESPIFLLSTVESDSHTWNLVYLQLLLEEQDINVINLGACVPHRDTVAAIRSIRPSAVVISSVNGHGLTQGRTLIQLARETLPDGLPSMVIGGMLTTQEAGDERATRELLAAGYSSVFCGADAVARFHQWLASSWPSLLNDHRGTTDKYANAAQESEPIGT